MFGIFGKSKQEKKRDALKKLHAIRKMKKESQYKNNNSQKMLSEMEKKASKKLGGISFNNNIKYAYIRQNENNNENNNEINSQPNMGFSPNLNSNVKKQSKEELVELQNILGEKNTWNIVEKANKSANFMLEENEKLKDFLEDQIEPFEEKIKYFVNATLNSPSDEIRSIVIDASSIKDKVTKTINDYNTKANKLLDLIAKIREKKVTMNEERKSIGGKKTAKRSAKRQRKNVGKKSAKKTRKNKK